MQVAIMESMSEAAQWKTALAKLEGAYSDNTLRGYRADFGKFDAWCHSAGVPSVPANAETVALFVAADAEASAPATLKRRLVAIAKIHRVLGHVSPADAEIVALAFRRALRTKRRRPRQASGLNAAFRDRLIAACPQSLMGFRDRAMMAVGYDTLCRRSELVALAVEDLSPLPEGGARILIRRAKNDPFGDGRWGCITPGTLVHLSAWLQTAGIVSGPIFRALYGNRVAARGLDPVAVNRALKRAARRAGISEGEVAGLSGHSMRVGAAQDLMRAGRDVLAIMTAGGWTSINVVGRYVRDAPFNIWSAPSTVPAILPAGAHVGR